MVQLKEQEEHTLAQLAEGTTALTGVILYKEQMDTKQIFIMLNIK